MGSFTNHNDGLTDVNISWRAHVTTTHTPLEDTRYCGGLTDTRAVSALE
jgi:hypothetical protein